MRTLSKLLPWISSTLLLVLCLTSFFVQANPSHFNGTWYSVHPYDGNAAKDSFLADPLNEKHLQVVDKINLTGGHYLYIANFNIDEPDTYIIDFKNTSTVAQFKHRIYSLDNKLIAEMEGGIENATPNPFYLRHGRDISLQPGSYKLISEIISTNFLATPEPYLDHKNAYVQSIKYGNTLTLICLGVFLGLGIYYAALATLRNRLAEAMYACFILGNFLFNGAALLVFSDVLGVHSIHWATMPILFSNMAYILFAMALLEIKIETKPRLYWAGVAILTVMALFIGFGLAYPNWALELCRYGVGMFLCFGLVAAITETIRHNPTAKRYLVAISTFFVLGLISISLSQIENQYTFYIEHIGLVSVAIEVMLLALVLAFQFSQLVSDKENALFELELSVKAAFSDALTGLPNRHALGKELLNMPMSGTLTFIDLDGLKFYNDMFGHERGDDLLCGFGECYQKSLGGELKLYRLGGDEFAVLSYKDDIAKIEQALKEALHAMRVAGFEFAGASAGSVHRYEAESIASLMRIADERMYENKRVRKGNKSEEIQEELKFNQDMDDS